MLLRTKGTLSKLRASTLRQKTQDFQSHTPAPIAKKALISKENYKYIGKVENIGIDEGFAHSKSVVFSGTDNGFHTMTETASLSTKKFEFSLKPYNMYSVLEQETENIDSDEFQNSA
ncbi:hypothetical protein K7432_017337 [Basidiobolus ranarum]|uniref:Uncharacterized protein n=1 Tax=Basidiobolus ranarum TaxID=34480 RepID=A0ABR2VKI6_9FUNG